MGKSGGPTSKPRKQKSRASVGSDAGYRALDGKVKDWQIGTREPIIRLVQPLTRYRPFDDTDKRWLQRDGNEYRELLLSVARGEPKREPAYQPSIVVFPEYATPFALAREVVQTI